MMKAVGVKNINKINDGTGKVKAFVNVLFSLTEDGDAVLTINGCKLIEGSKGLFVAMPSQPYEKDGEKKWSDIVFLDTRENEDARELQKSINEVVIAEWNKVNGGNNKKRQSNSTPKTSGGFDDDDVPW